MFSITFARHFSESTLKFMTLYFIRLTILQIVSLSSCDFQLINVVSFISINLNY